jgi:hypothetical protein
MSLKIAPFEAWHLERLEARRFEAQELACLGDVKRRAVFYQQAGPAWTGLYDGEIMACCGVIILWAGVAEAWLVTTNLCEQHRLSFHRAIKQNLARLIADMGLQRLQAAVHAEHVVSQKWVERLGFSHEGLMAAYGPDGSDYVRYAKVT